MNRLLLLAWLALSSFAALASPGTNEPVLLDGDGAVFDPDLNPALIGGDVADPAEWPASPWIGNCSSTLIGDQVLLTAAHCVRNGGTTSFTIGATRYSARCTHHASYRRNSTADWALCVVSSSVPSIEFESLAYPGLVNCSEGQEFLWTGYGCTRWGGRIDGKFRTGTVDAIRCPSGSNYDTVTRGDVALCSGDSGGGGYLVAPSGRRYLVGVNSRSNTRDTSYVSSTYVETFFEWARSWADEHEVKICGVHEDAERCRGIDPPPPDPDPDPDPVPPSCATEREALTAALGDVQTAHQAMEQCFQAR